MGTYSISTIETTGTWDFYNKRWTVSNKNVQKAFGLLPDPNARRPFPHGELGLKRTAQLRNSNDNDKGALSVFGKYRYFIGPAKGSLLTRPTNPVSLPSGHLVNRLLGDFKNMAVNGSVFVAELPKTRDLVRGIVTDAVAFLRSLRAGKPRDALKHLLSDPSSKGLANRWLQYQYGIMPTVMEVSSALEYLAKRVENGVYVSRRATDTNGFSANYTVLNQWNSPIYVDQFAFDTFTKRVTASGTAKVSYTKAGTLASWGFTNPTLLWWELIPFSFVFDWAIPVGDWLNTLDSQFNYDGLIAIQLSYKSETRRTVEVTARTDSGGSASTTCYFNSDEFYRDLPTGYPFGALPPLNPHLSVKRLISALALIRQTS